MDKSLAVFWLSIAIVIAAFYFSSPWIGLLFILSVFIFFPEGKFKSRMFSVFRGIGKTLGGLIYFSIAIVCIIAVFIFFQNILNSLGNIGKYDGKTAQEWEEAYQNAEEVNKDIGDCLTTKSLQWDYIDARYTPGNIYTNEFGIYQNQAYGGWLYSGVNASASTSPTDEMKHCFSTSLDTISP